MRTSQLMTNSVTNSASAAEPGLVSVIVPVWREAESLLAKIRKIVAWPEVREVIVVVAEGSAPWQAKLAETGAQVQPMDHPNRGRQMNRGAETATGEWLLFHHADTLLEASHVRSLAALSARAEVIGGAFYRKFDERHPYLRWLEPIERWRNRRSGALYGDQSLFVRREHFQKLGGFADIPLMEDVEFSRRLRRSGRIALLDPPIASSPRKHLRYGPWRTTFQNATLILLYKLGVSPHRLHAWYYPAKAQISNPIPVDQHHEKQVHPIV